MTSQWICLKNVLKFVLKFLGKSMLENGRSETLLKIVSQKLLGEQQFWNIHFEFCS